MQLENPLFALLFLIGSALVSGTMTALQQVGRLHAKESLQKKPFSFLYLSPLFGEKKWQSFSFHLKLTQIILYLCFSIFAFLFLIPLEPSALETFLSFVIVLAAALLTTCITDLIALSRPKIFFHLLSPLAFPFLILSAPLTVLFVFLQRIVLQKAAKENLLSDLTFRDKVFEILHESDEAPRLEPNDEKLILSVASFKEKIAREVMVPRINMFSLAEDTTIEEAAERFVKEGYSRIPVYKDSVDHIIGVLLYKDVLNLYTSRGPKMTATLKSPIESLVKPVLYTPETKKISHLLQEFRSKQIHLAIVVDEYGGTEGIVTIEDILEELVGEIADEYDIEEEGLFSALPGGGWIVDARMNILDIEEELGIKIPQSAEYDTLGGYIFHRAGAIPLRGWKIHHDNYDLEVLSSNERSIEKILITKTAS